TVKYYSFVVIIQSALVVLGFVLGITTVKVSLLKIGLKGDGLGKICQSCIIITFAEIVNTFIVTYFSALIRGKVSGFYRVASFLLSLNTGGINLCPCCGYN